MRLQPTTERTPEDWVGHVRYRRQGGPIVERTICCSAEVPTVEWAESHIRRSLIRFPKRRVGPTRVDFVRDVAGQPVVDAPEVLECVVMRRPEMIAYLAGLNPKQAKALEVAA